MNIYRQTHRQAHRHTDRPKDIHTYMHTNIHTYIHTYIHTTNKQLLINGDLDVRQQQLQKLHADDFAALAMVLQQCERCRMVLLPIAHIAE
jgi:hypothetical protein